MVEAWANRGHRSCDQVIHCFRQFPWRTFLQHGREVKKIVQEIVIRLKIALPPAH